MDKGKENEEKRAIRQKSPGYRGKQECAALITAVWVDVRDGRKHAS